MKHGEAVPKEYTGLGEEEVGRPPTLNLEDIEPRELTPEGLLLGRDLGFCRVFSEQEVVRTSAYRIKSSVDDVRLRALESFFANPDYCSDRIGFARLQNIVVDNQFSVCMTQDGRLIPETEHVAKIIEPSLVSIPFLKPGHDRSTYDAITVPVLHCFHRSSPGYGYFIFDCLPAILFFRQAILAGRLKVLLPSFLKPWVLNILQRIGLEPSLHFVRPNGPASICSEVVIPNFIDCRNTFRPNLDLCRGLADLGKTISEESENTFSHIYITRKNQRVHSERALENELDVQKTLRRLGYVVIEPGNLSFAKQIEIFRQARVIVGAHGSAFANLVFAQPGAHVVDLMPADWVHFRDHTGTRERWLLNVTTALGLDYSVLLCSSRLLDGPIRHGKKPIIYNVDVAKLRDVASTLKDSTASARGLKRRSWLRSGLRKLGVQMGSP